MCTCTYTCSYKIVSTLRDANASIFPWLRAKLKYSHCLMNGPQDMTQHVGGITDDPRYWKYGKRSFERYVSTVKLGYVVKSTWKSRETRDVWFDGKMFGESVSLELWYSYVLNINLYRKRRECTDTIVYLLFFSILLLFSNLFLCFFIHKLKYFIHRILHRNLT